MKNNKLQKKYKILSRKQPECPFGKPAKPLNRKHITKREMDEYMLEE